MKAIVIGGGIGGMAAALSLRNEGIEVEVYEQAPALTEIGAGLQIAPSAGRVLERLGLGAELGRLAISDAAAGDARSAERSPDPLGLAGLGWSLLPGAPS